MQHPGNAKDVRTRAATRLATYWPALLLFAGLVCPLVLSTWYTFNTQRNTLERAFRLEMEQVSQVLARGMQEPIWNLTPNLGRPVIDSLMNDERIIGVRVTSIAQGDFLRAVKAL